MFVYKLAERLLRLLNIIFDIKYLQGFLRRFSTKEESQINMSELLSELSKIPIKRGGILILHSSWSQLVHSKINPKDIIDFLLLKLGDSGTLVMPAFYMENSNLYLGGEKEVNVDVTSRLTSSGILPSFFLRYPDVYRGRFPYNTLAAKGSHAKSMFKNEEHSSKAHDEHSPWDFCRSNNAIIAFLGVKSRNSTTLIHVAEDNKLMNWPIKDWWEERIVLINDEKGVRRKKIEIRKPEYSIRNLSYSRTKYLVRKKLLKEWSCKGVSFGYIEDSKKLIDEISRQARSSNIFWWI